ncbi:hypothetical protein INT44_006986 [Umbelopsis vinacea]|uniref:Uncharacterized protein n=1 Tax=Umbelopsis vinacea TaxID=44442 RepID=A0A8H7PFL7_9FUNG|nr:hypothetical protein INT44_006986 [Umbelopsis vinacea]
MMAVKADYLLSLRSVREQTKQMQHIVQSGRLQHFDIDLGKMEEVVRFVTLLVKRDYDDPSDMPSHSRWRHFEVGGKPRIKQLVSSWASATPTEKAKRLIDLCVMSVLLDVNPLHHWAYQEKSTGRTHKRTEGIAIAVLDLFKSGLFSSDPGDPNRVDASALADLTLDDLTSGFQLNAKNSLIGLEDRINLIQHVTETMKDYSNIFAGNDKSSSRPGNMLDYILSHPSTVRSSKGTTVIQMETLWSVAILLGELWAQGSPVEGRSVGDVWPCEALRSAGFSDPYVPFHTTTQWLCYSIVEVLETQLGITVDGKDQLTPLTDYPNGNILCIYLTRFTIPNQPISYHPGGLLLDTGFLTLKKGDLESGLSNYRRNSLLPGQPKMEVTPMFDISDPVVIEWRALTITYSEMIASKVRDKLKSRKNLSLSQILEGGIWNAGRELAEISRPNTQEPPIVIKVSLHCIHIR